MAHSLDELPALFRVEGEALVCGGCRRKWRKEEPLSQQNFEYLYEHATTHTNPRKHHPDHQTRFTKWSEPKLDPVQCQTCFSWFQGRRCPKCFPPFQLRRGRNPRIENARG